MVHEVQKQSDSDLIMIQYNVEALGRSSTNFFASSGDVNEGDFSVVGNRQFCWKAQRPFHTSCL